MLPDADEGFLNNVVGNISIMRLEEHLAKDNRLVPLKELAECLFLGRSQAFNELIICRVSATGVRVCADRSGSWIKILGERVNIKEIGGGG